MAAGFAIGAAQLFWLALALPGFALLWRYDRRSLEGGVLAGLARSYLLSFLLLTPVSVIGHVLQLPLWTLSAAYVTFVLGAVISLCVERSWLRELHAPSLVAAIGGTVLLADCVLGAYAGTHVGGDAGYHIARVRLLVDLGLNSWDPLIAERRFDAIYHTNLYHALIACSAQLTQSDAGLAWVATWPFAKLLTAAGAYQLGVVVLGARWLGWTAALTALAFHAASSTLPFPNTLAPVALLPMGVAAGIEAMCKPSGPRPAFWIAASALMLAQTHALNAAFLALVLAPCLLLVLGYKLVRSRPGKRWLLVAIVACGASAPWLLVPSLPRIEGWLGHATPAPIAADSGSKPATVDADGGGVEPTTTTPNPRKVHKAASFMKLDNGLTMLDPRQLAGRDGRNFVGFCALVFLLAMLPRARLWAFAACMAMTCTWLVVPVLCSALMRVIGAPWAVARLGNVLVIGVCTMVPAALFAITNRLRRHALPRAAIGLAAVAGALAYGQAAGTNYGPWNTQEYLLAVERHRAAQTAQTIRDRSEFFGANIAPGSTVMANNRWDYNLPMHFRCYTLALNPGRGWHGVPFQQERRALVDEFFTARTPGARRLEILRKYQIHYVYTSRNFTPLLLRSMSGHADVRAVSKQGVILYVTL